MPKPTLTPLPSQNISQVLYVATSGLSCCVDLEYVVRVEYLMELQSIPQSPPFIKGLLDLHGESIFVLDLCERLGVPNDELYTIDTPVLLCRSHGRVVGLILGDEPILSATDQAGLCMSEMFQTGAPFFNGVVNTDQGLSLLLDIDQLLDFDLTLHDLQQDIDHDKLLQQAEAEMLRDNSMDVHQ